jgi:hypothetical protein
MNKDRETGNAESTKYMLLSCHLNAGRNRDIKIINMSFENVVQLKYWETVGTNQNLILGEIRGE